MLALVPVLCQDLHLAWASVVEYSLNFNFRQLHFELKPSGFESPVETGYDLCYLDLEFSARGIYKGLRCLYLDLCSLGRVVKHFVKVLSCIHYGLVKILLCVHYIVLEAPSTCIDGHHYKL